MADQRYLILDYETRSEIDLKKVGAYEYARHLSTQILCVSWRVGSKGELKHQLENNWPAKVWSPAGKFNDDFKDFVRLLSSSNHKLIAHNAFFEQMVTRFVLPRLSTLLQYMPLIPHDRWHCTAAGARALALPGHLEGAALALNLPVKKDMEGRKLVLKMCKPRKATKSNSKKWHDSKADLKRLMQYCQTDVDAETHLFLQLPDLHPTERKVWLLDQKINSRGFKVDRPLVLNALKMIDMETRVLNIETNNLTNGELSSATQRNAALSWLEKQNVFLPDLRAKTVADTLKDSGGVKGPARRLLEIRQSISKTSTAKYEAFEQRSRTDGRLRDILVYHTASTGRWGGSGVQPQNFYRPTMHQKDVEHAVKLIREEGVEALNWINTLYGSPMEVLANCLRSVIIAPEDKELFCADYAAIEARVLAWIAKHEVGLKAFRENQPIYELMAMVIYNLDHLEQVTKAQRQVGKQSELGCGYGMGWKKFMATCENFGIPVTEQLAKTAVNAYRSTHQPVVKCWSNLERASILAVRNPGKRFKVNCTTWWVDKNFLWCGLPSGRKLAYYGPEIQYKTTPWNEKRPVLYHYGVNPLSRAWELGGTYGGRLTENVVQAVARDFMAAAMLRLDEKGYETVLTVHDEDLAERVKGEGSVDEFTSLMAEIPPWGAGCPIKVEGWSGPRYRK